MSRRDRPPRRMRIMAWVLLCLALLQITWQAACLARGVEFVVSTLTVDDTYYYMQTAWNTGRLGFPTFDGIHPTNGVQLLWFWVLVPIATLSPTKTFLLYAALALCILLNASCYFVCWRLGRVLRRPVLVLGLACLWQLMNLTGIYLTGMENSLHAFLFWCTVWQATVFVVRVQRRERPNLLGLTVVLVLNAWTRIDGGIYSAVLYAACVARALASRTLRLPVRRDAWLVTGSALLAFSGLAVQLLTFWWMGGSWLPVSALVKSSWVRWDAGATTTVAVMAICAVLPAAGLRITRRYVQEHKELIAFRVVWQYLLVGFLIHLVPAVAINAHREYVWYLSPWYIYAIVSVALVVDGTASLIGAKESPAALRLILAGMGVLVAGVSLLASVMHLGQRNPLYIARYRAARWMADELPEDAICVSWNAGQISYFSDRTVINLDGLINGIDYYTQVIRGPDSVMNYILENQAGYAVDRALERRLPFQFPVLREFPIGDGDSKIQIWHLSSPKPVEDD